MARKYGFMRLADLRESRVSEVDVQELNDALDEVTSEHQKLIAAVEAAWVEVTTEWKFRHNLTEGGSHQPLDANGEPLPDKETGYYDVAVPIKSGGSAWGADRITGPHMTVAEAQRQTDRVFRKDANWIRRHIIAAVLTKTEYTVIDDLKGSITVTPLANGDSVTYYKEALDDLETDNHYLGQANAIGNGADNPFATIHAELSEHPSNMVDGANPVVAYVASNLKASIIALNDFYPIANGLVRLGADSSFAVDVESFAPFGTVLGVVDTDGTQTVIVEWKSLPSNYMIVHATGAGQFVYHREFEPASLRGLTMETPAVSGNGLVKRQWIRHAGFAVFNRVAAVAYYIGNATYANPTNFTAPLAK